jgi:hypothetical protein
MNLPKSPSRAHGQEQSGNQQSLALANVLQRLQSLVCVTTSSFLPASQDMQRFRVFLDLMALDLVGDPHHPVVCAN